MYEKTQVFPPGRAVVFDGVDKPFRVLEKNIPAEQMESILIKNRYTTLCGSEIHTYSGRRKEPDNR